MSERYKLLTPVKTKSGGTFWHKVGMAYPANNGEGFNLRLNSLPFGTEEGAMMIMKLDDSVPNSSHQSKDIDDEVPF